MKIGLALPSLLAAKRYQERIFAPKELLIILANGLVANGHEVYVYGSSGIKTDATLINCPSFLEKDNYYSIKDIYKEHSHTYSSLRFFNEYEVGALTHAIGHANKVKLDILHDYMGYIGQYFMGLANMPMVFTLHDPVFPEDTLEFQRLKQFKNNNYLAISYSQSREYKEKLGIEAVEVIHHGLNINDFKFSDSAREHMVFYGRFIEVKGVTFAIELARLTKHPLKLASSKNYRDTDYYRGKIKPYIDSKIVTEVDFLGPKERNDFLGEAKLALFPIQWPEPFGMTLIESMACGTPVVAYGLGSVPEIIVDGKTGFIVNKSVYDITGDWVIKKTGLEGLIEAVERIYAMPKDKYKQMRRACRQYIERYFTADRMVENHIKAYKKITGGLI